MELESPVQAPDLSLVEVWCDHPVKGRLMILAFAAERAGFRLLRQWERAAAAGIVVAR
jgi:hypothetical protein